MNDKKKNRLSRLVFLLNGFLFILGGMTLMEEEKWVYGILQFLAGIFNFSMVPKYKNEKAKALLNYLVLVMNIIVAASIAIDYVLGGKQYIQYAWGMAALFSFVALVVEFRKERAISK